MQNFSSLAGLEVTENFMVGGVDGWLRRLCGGWVAGESGIKASLSLSLS